MLTNKMIGDKGTEVSGKMINLLVKLYERWQWEKEYEDWSEYEKVIKENFKKSFSEKFIKATKRPFGFKFMFEGVEVQIGLKQKNANTLVSYSKWISYK